MGRISSGALNPSLAGGVITYQDKTQLATPSATIL